MKDRVPLCVAYRKLWTEYIQVRTTETLIWTDEWTITREHEWEDADIAAYDSYGTIFSAPKDTPAEILEKSIRFQDRGQHVEIRFLDIRVRDRLEARLLL